MARRPGLTRWFVLAGGLIGFALSLIILRIQRGRRSMESQLRRALRSESLTLVYQPIVDLATGKIVAAEALARWIDEDGESVRPDVFVALAEEKGFAREITRLVVGFAAEELADLLAAGLLRVSINIAPTDLADDDFFRYLDHCLEFAHVPPSSIVLELTERSLADHDVAVRALGMLKSRGHRVYVDDFGIGYSNLATLHRLEVDGIKVDRAFTQTIGTESATASVLPQILEMARQMDLAVVVEGIETEEQADYFRKAGEGIYGQGWLFGRPMPAAQFRKLLTGGK
jgi:sensor c-di-GMP phosphodiesterase-like protein